MSRIHRTTWLLLLASAVGAIAIPSSARAGLSTTGFWQVAGVAPHDGLGFSTATAGDVNGDGFSDLLVSAKASTSGNSGVYLFYGSANGPVTPAAWKKENYSGGVRVSAAGDLNGDGYDDVIFGSGEIPAAPGGGWIEVRYGSATGLSNTPDFAESYPLSSGGYSVGAAGDVNGDGYDDVLVGDPTYSCGYTESGRLAVYYGGPSGLDGTVWFWCGPNLSDYSRVGESFAGVGDVNGDGYDDLLSNNRNAFGWNEIMQFLGAAVGLGDRSGVFQVNVSNSSSEWGHLIAPAGDVNGDGYADILVGDPHSGAAASDSGVVSLAAGGPNGITGHSPNGSLVAIAIMEGPGGSQFGSAGFTAGDINGDGLADIVIGAPRSSSSPSEQLEGMFATYLSTGTNVSALQPAIEGNVAGMGLGASICAAGDVNGDGFGDVIVGAPQANVGLGQVRVYYGAAEKPAATAITRFGGQQSAVGGWAVAAGDVNGDGFEDVLMGVPNGDAGATDNGFVSLYLGRSGGIAATPVWTAPGPSPGSGFGVSAAMGLDVNGDGLGDVVVGAHVDNGVGSISVYHGRSNWSGSSTSPNTYIVGTQSGAQFGASVAFAGDVDGDGYADVLVGSPLQDQGLTDVGKVWLFAGSSAGLSVAASWSSVGTQTDEHRGAVASAGDVSNDGYSDVIVGAPGYDDGASADAGRALVYLGGPSGLSTTPQQEWHGETAGSLFGQSVAGVGDMDGDGWGEVAVGSYSFGSTGKVYVYRGSSSGSDAAASWTQAGAQVNGAFGSTVAAAGDVNGDGRSDLLVGAVFQDGAGGTDCGRGYVFTGPFPLSTFADFAGPSNFANMGHAIAAGDVNGDGFGDLLFGEPRLFQTQFDEGGFQLYLGNRGAGRSRPTYLSQPLNAIPVALYGRSPSNTSVGFNGEVFSPGGRDRIAFEFAVDPMLSGITPQRGRSPFVMMGAPTDPDHGAISFGQQVGFLISNSVYAWRVRPQTKSPYFRYGPWISPQPNARCQWDFRTAPRTTDVPAAVQNDIRRLRVSPNPAAPVTRLSFVLPRSAEVSLTVRDVSGRAVRRLASGWCEAGPHEVAWDGQDDSGRPCAAGLYFAVMRTPTDRQALRFSLLR